MLCRTRVATYVVQSVLTNELTHPALLQTSRPTTRSLICKTHAVAIAMHAWRWLVHLCGRANPSTRAQRPASRAPPTRPRGR
eukprot:5924011-Pyramimonas_sp.AAC.1